MPEIYINYITIDIDIHYKCKYFNFYLYNMPWRFNYRWDWDIRLKDFPNFFWRASILNVVIMFESI